MVPDEDLAWILLKARPYRTIRSEGRKSSDALKPSNARLRPIRTTLCAHCGSDKLRKQISLAHCASHQLATLLPFNLCGNARPNASFDSGGPLKNSGKNFIRRILVT